MPEPQNTDTDTDTDDEVEFWRGGAAIASGPRRRGRDWSADPDRIASLRVGCPHCHAPAGSVCRNRDTATELARLPCHPIRLTEAGGTR